MLHIGKGYLARADGMTRLCADVTIGERRTTLWFAVESNQEEYLTLGRSDPFVMAMLPAAMRGSHEIVCEDPMSERLHYQLCCHAIPAFAFAGELYHAIRITAPLTAVPYRSQGAVGTGFSGGVDSLYTVMQHGPGSDCPLTHLAMFDTGALEPENGPEKIARFHSQGRRFAEERGLDTVIMSTNLEAALSNAERSAEVYIFRLIARVLALQGLFSMYVFSSGTKFSEFSMNLREPSFHEALILPCSSTESLAFYDGGAVLDRYGKLEILSEWEPSYRWMHQCTYGAPGDMNCGHCKKCIRDMAALWAYGKLDRYKAVFDVPDFEKNLTVRLGSALAKPALPIFGKPIELLKNCGRPIPPAAWVYARHFERAMANVAAREAEKGPTH